MHRLSLLPPLLLVLSLALPRDVRAQSFEWRRLPNAPVAARHNDVKFLNPMLGWVCNASGQLWKTTDGGDSWSQLLQVGVTLRSLYFVNESIGLAGTVNESQLLYRTTNGGQSWVRIDSLIPNPRPLGLCGMMGLGERIFACGKFTGPARLIKSSDAGATWTSMDLAPHLQVAIDCRFTTPDSGFVVGGAGTPNIVPTIIFTSDGGQTWVTRHSGGNGDYCWKIFFVNSQVGYTSLQGQSVLKTTDGGVTWIEKPVGTTIDNIQGIGFADEMLGWIDGFSGNTLMTTDGGDTWSPVMIDPPDPALNRFQMFSSTLGYASGKSVYKYLPVTTAVELADVPAQGTLALTCWPNPFNPQTSIRYRNPHDGPVMVRIYTVRNETAFQIFSGHQAAGWNELTWDGRDTRGRMMPSGCYFVRVDAGRSADSRMVTLLK